MVAQTSDLDINFSYDPRLDVEVTVWPGSLVGGL